VKQKKKKEVQNQNIHLQVQFYKIEILFFIRGFKFDLGKISQSYSVRDLAKLNLPMVVQF
jgi:hypothetical protein